MTVGVLVEQAQTFLVTVPDRWIEKPFSIKQLEQRLGRLAQTVDEGRQSTPTLGWDFLRKSTMTLSRVKGSSQALYVGPSLDVSLQVIRDAGRRGLRREFIDDDSAGRRNLRSG